jgi:hypothetical protein
LILFLGQPAYALSIVLAALLFFSGIGSLFSKKYQLKQIFLLLVMVLIIVHFILIFLLKSSLGLSLGLRIIIAFLIISPMGLLMGMPFPKGINQLSAIKEEIIPWMWGINGAASVVASILAALLVITTGFNRVLWIGIFFYVCAGLIIYWGLVRAGVAPH